MLHALRKLAVVVVSLMAVSTAVAAVPAEAATIHGCPAGYLCLYRLDDFKGGMAKFAADDTNLTNNYFSGTKTKVYHSASSMVNNRNQYFFLFFNKCSIDSYNYYNAKKNSEDSTFSNNTYNGYEQDNHIECLLKQSS